jgi:hypothetical protein
MRTASLILLLAAGPITAAPPEAVPTQTAVPTFESVRETIRDTLPIGTPQARALAWLQKAGVRLELVARPMNGNDIYAQYFGSIDPRSGRFAIPRARIGVRVLFKNDEFLAITLRAEE